MRKKKERSAFHFCRRDNSSNCELQGEATAAYLTYTLPHPREREGLEIKNLYRSCTSDCMLRFDETTRPLALLIVHAPYQTSCIPDVLAFANPMPCLYVTLREQAPQFFPTTYLHLQAKQCRRQCINQTAFHHDPSASIGIYREK